MKLNISFVIIILLANIVSAGQFSLFAENDVIYHTDHYYTHGTRLQYIDNNDLGYTFGQNMYTPNNKSIKELQPDDRPYAGYLYAGMFKTYYFTNNTELFVEAEFGTVGPNSYAEETQIWVHKHIGSMLPAGWDNQIANHAIALLVTKYTTHFLSSEWFSIDPYVGAKLGNLMDDVNAGINVYAGYNLPKSRNSSRTIPVKLENPKWNFYSYVFAGIEPKLVFYNMTMNDKRFDIDPNLFVYDTSYGVVMGCKYCELSVSWCESSKEFDKQVVPEKYGSIKLSFSF